MRLDYIGSGLKSGLGGGGCDDEEWHEIIGAVAVEPVQPNKWFPEIGRRTADELAAAAVCEQIERERSLTEGMAQARGKFRAQNCFWHERAVDCV